MSLPPCAQGSIAGGMANPLPVRESHPLEAPSFAWRAKVRGGEVIQQYIEADVEQIPPATHQMIKQRRLVLKQQIMAVIERVLVDNTVHPQQIRQRTASIPLTM